MKADLHMHTNFSYDGLPFPEEVVNAAISKKIDCICICDHGEIKGAIEALRFAKGKPILVIPGIESRAKEGEVLGLGIQKEIPDGLSVRETIKRIIDQGGLAAIAHPFDYFLGFKEIEKYKDFFQEKGVAIEVFNASLFFNFCNIEALEFAEKFNLPFTAGSDAHSVDFIGKAYLEIPKENLSASEVLEEIRKRNVKVGFEGISFWEKLGDHLKRNIAKFKNLKR
ncbi:PHP domain-containing protein [Patescibacteria group bacterium]|nr:PHP domain-containing protein [Patescibacteria group bacterium]